MSREWDVDVQNVLSRELCAFCALRTFYLVNFVDLFYPDGVMRHTAKSNLLNEIKINKYLLPSLLGNADLGATVTDFMAILQSIDYSKFERFCNVADKISTKFVASFLDCEVLVAVTDRYDFKNSIKLLKENTGQRTQLICRKLKLLTTKNFQSYLGNLNNKTNLLKNLSKNGEEHCRKFQPLFKPIIWQIFTAQQIV